MQSPKMFNNKKDLLKTITTLQLIKTIINLECYITIYYNGTHKLNIKH